MENKPDQIELKIIGLGNIKKISFWKKVFASQEPQYSIILSKKDDNLHRIGFVLGKNEAQSIAVFIEKKSAPIPFTHEFFKSATDEFNYKLDHILITKAANSDLFQSIMHYSGDTKKIELVARTADAIPLAIRHGSPIFIEKTVFEKHAIRLKTKPVVDTNSLDDMKEELAGE
jgi:bifunctional DNase/RNase